MCELKRFPVGAKLSCRMSDGKTVVGRLVGQNGSWLTLTNYASKEEIHVNLRHVAAIKES